MQKRLLLDLLALVLAGASARLSSGQESIIELTNADIVTMVRAKLPQELIIAKIKSSRCRFDTFPEVTDLRSSEICDLLFEIDKAHDRIEPLILGPRTSSSAFSKNTPRTID